VACVSQQCKHNRVSRSLRYRHEIRTKLLALFGGKCVRCGFDDKRALQLDHVNGGGRKEFRDLGAWSLYRKALKHPEGYQLLCANCNWIKRYEEKESN
jgi:hypothetical protein